MMKQLFSALVLSFIIVFPIFAKRDIALINEKGTWDKSKRSINHPPTISHDENIFYIHSALSIEDAQITIKDLNDDIIYSTRIALISGGSAITVSNMDSGSYTIELEYEDNYYYGYFEVTQ